MSTVWRSKVAVLSEEAEREQPHGHHTLLHDADPPLAERFCVKLKTAIGKQRSALPIAVQVNVKFHYRC